MKTEQGRATPETMVKVMREAQEARKKKGCLVCGDGTVPFHSCPCPEGKELIRQGY